LVVADAVIPLKPKGKRKWLAHAARSVVAETVIDPDRDFIEYAPKFILPLARGTGKMSPEIGWFGA
jgi:hypothetical protein